MRQNHTAIRVYLVAMACAVLAFSLSALFKILLGAPNYGLGVVIGVTLACYFSGLLSATVVYLLSISALTYFLIPPAGGPIPATRADWIRVITIMITSAITCALVQMVRKAESRTRHQKELIEEQNLQLAAQNEELQAQNEEIQSQSEEIQSQSEEIQSQSEEIQSQNEELQTINEELKETHEQLILALQHETHIAQTLQQAFLPLLPESVGSIKLSAIYEAGSNEAEIGGDFYDVFPLPDGRLAIAIGDASGKGLLAARQAIIAKHGLRFCARQCEDPGECLQMLNNFLVKDGSFSGFITLFYGIIDHQRTSLTYCTGGHLPPLLHRRVDGSTIELEPAGRFIGIFTGGSFESHTVQLKPGDRVLMFTDGLVEARNSGGMFGSERLADLLVDGCDDGKVSNSLYRIVDAVKAFADGKLSDDAAAVMVLVEEES